MYIDMDCACKGRNLDKLLQPLILCILCEEGELHGFAIMKIIAKNQLFEGKVPDAAGVYRYLKKMEMSDLLVSKWDISNMDENGKSKRIFDITDKGRACLNNWMHALNEYKNYIQSLVERIEKIL